MNAASRTDLAWDLARLGVGDGDTIMVHCSLKAVGPVSGGPATIVDALLHAVGPHGNLMAYVSWDQSPYEETLNGGTLNQEERDDWPAFDPRTAGTFRGFGMLNEFICRHPRALRSGHPDASMAAIGPKAAELIHPHDLSSAYGRGSPLERFVGLQGRVLLLGAPLDTVTLLHYAEAIAHIPGKRTVTYEVPLLEAGRKVWKRVEEFDSNGILDCFADGDAPDAVEQIAHDYVKSGYSRQGRVAKARCHLFDAAPLVDFGVEWLERRFGAAKAGAHLSRSRPSTG